MAFKVAHNVEKGVRQLLDAPSDIAHLVPPQGRPRPLSEAAAGHRQLFALYLADLSTAYAIGDEWWKGCVGAFQGLGHSADEANELAYEKRVAGPASAPEVVWFVRSYWMAFDKLNTELPEGERVPPAVALLGWLVDGDHDDYVRLLTCMPYWPIGLDAEGNWC